EERALEVREHEDLPRRRDGGGRSTHRRDRGFPRTRPSGRIGSRLPRVSWMVASRGAKGSVSLPPTEGRGLEQPPALLLSPSFNGRTRLFGSRHRGSSPRGEARRRPPP